MLDGLTEVLPKGPYFIKMNQAEQKNQLKIVSGSKKML